MVVTVLLCVSTTRHEMRQKLVLHSAHAPDAAEIVGLVVIQIVAETRHPHVRGDEDADGVVHLTRVEVVVQQEKAPAPVGTWLH